MPSKPLRRNNRRVWSPIGFAIAYARDECIGLLSPVDQLPSEWPVTRECPVRFRDRLSERSMCLNRELCTLSRLFRV